MFRNIKKFCYICLVKLKNNYIMINKEFNFVGRMFWAFLRLCPDSKIKNRKIASYLRKGDVMYNPYYNGFHQIRQIKEDTVVMSGCCNFIDDTRTTVNYNEVPIAYVNKLKPVYKKHKFMEWNKTVDGYESTSKKENKAYLFYEDKCIINSKNNINEY